MSHFPDFEKNAIQILNKNLIKSNGFLPQWNANTKCNMRKT